jgi:D-alanyl-D-alanine carboxypeptidase
MFNNILFAILFSLPQIFAPGEVNLNNELFQDQKSVEEKSISEEESKVTPPEKVTESLGVKLNAKAAVVLDRKSGEILYEKAGQEKLPMASLTKLMTALVSLESKINLNDTVIIKSNSVEVEGLDINLEVGEKIKISDLLFGTLIASGNDAAQAIAEYTSGNIEDFVSQMNKKAAELGLYNTHYVGVTGLDVDGHYSSARDSALLADYAFDNPELAPIVEIKEYEFTTDAGKTHHFKNTNLLLRDDYPKVRGGKTGFTDNAGYCLINLAADEKNNQIITVVLGEKENGDQFQDTKALIDWTFKNYKWKDKKGQEAKEGLTN